jgi:glycosyl hydrolase family 16
MPSLEPAPLLDRSGYVLEREDQFVGPDLDRTLWFPHYLPQWSSRQASAARYSIEGGRLRLLIEADQQPWCPEFNGWLRVSSLQTGVFAGPVGSTAGQHHFRDGLVVREEQSNLALYTPRYGLFEVRARALDDPSNMVALWMIGFEDDPAHSAEICIFEIFGRDVAADSVKVGMGVHPFGDPTIVDAFSAEAIEIDAREVHAYAVEWTPEHVGFYVDDRLVKIVGQSPSYPMQFMLNIYEFADGPELPSETGRYPKVFEIAAFRGYRRLEDR